MSRGKMPFFILGGLILMVITGLYALSRNERGETVIVLQPPAGGESIPTDQDRKKIPFEDLFREAGRKNSVDWRLIAAHAFVESSFNPRAKNPEGSYGLMQIYTPLLKNKGVVRHLTRGSLPEFENFDVARLVEPEYSIMLGAALIRENVKEFFLPRAIAVYNSDGATKEPQHGPFKNQTYVNRVLSYYDKLKEEIPL